MFANLLHTKCTQVSETFLTAVLTGRDGGDGYVGDLVLLLLVFTLTPNFHAVLVQHDNLHAPVQGAAVGRAVGLCGRVLTV
jgi:hypothetical protein